MHTPLRMSPAHASGMTLIESLVVILIMIVVITVVFMGARTWKKDADRTACISNIRNVQHVVRAFQNSHGLPDRAPINIQHELIGPKLDMINEPNCPAYGNYSYSGMIPPVGSLAITCSLSSKEAHHPTTHQGW
jgi:type II secretory pathway pseudopilin PulG